MAKRNYFKWFGQFLTSLNAFPVDRENPGPSTLKRPVNLLKEIKLLVSSQRTSYISEGAPLKEALQLLQC